MKKLFDRTKNSLQEWEGYDENDWDSPDGDVDEPLYYEEDDDGAYYADTDEDVQSEDDGVYYADEDDTYDFVENDTYDSVEDETYYSDGEPVEEEDTGLYFMDDETGEFYEDAYEAEEDEPEDEMEAGYIAGGKKGFAAKLQDWLYDLTVMDKVIFGTGAVVLVLALITGGLYISSRSVDNQVSEFVDVGAQLNGIDTIGEAGLLAVADAQMAKMAAAEMVAEDMDQDRDEDYDEQEFAREIQVGLEFTSIQRDLKIKFINKKTGKLVANVPFAVTITDPDGKTSIWSDDDMDGIIYKKDITPGKYSVAMEALTDEKYADYIISTTGQSVTVKKDIAYEKVDVDNEVKSEDEVNASKEDTKVNETVVESVLKDTVTWVESAQYPASYIEVPPSSITNPKTILSQAMNGTFFRTVSGGNASTTEPTEPSEPTPTPELTVTLKPATVSVAAGQTVTSQADVTVSGAANSGVTFSVDPASNSNASVTVDNSGKVTVKGVAAGTSTFTITAKMGDITGKASLTVTVVAQKAITLNSATAIAFTGEPLTINAAITGATTNDPTVTAASSDTSVATVSVSKTAVTVNGLKAGTTTITVSFTENNETVQAQCVVTVKAHPKNDTTTKLKNNDGTQVYVLENGKYREAVYADYFKDSVKFYLMGEMKYTGWQTINGNVYFYTSDGKKVTGEQVIQGAKYTFASDGSLVTGSGALGIDVSKWNGNIDWNAVKNSGINYVIIRCGYRGSSAGSLIEDPKFTANIKGATAAGLKVGIYFFTQAVDEREAVEEASMVLGQVKNYKISYPIFLDVESSGGRADSIDRATRTAVCKAFCQTIQNAGYTAGIYANKNWWETKIDASALSAYKIWLAQYAAAPTYKGRYDLWQYRSSGKVSGISTDVDMNLSYLGY